MKEEPMKRLAILVLLLVLIPTQAEGLDTTELLGLVAMPLAVAAVADAAGVPATELGQVVAALNQANLPPTQFVQVVRYVPVALVVEEERPRFVQFVQNEVSHGVTGTQLVEVIDTKLRTYHVEPQFIALEEPATTYVISDHYVVTSPLRTEFGSNDLLALAAMPLAVSAVADISGISVGELSNFVATLNAANVAPVQVIEVLRYAPVALVADTDPEFVQFVRSEFNQGTTGDALVTVIANRLRDYDITPQIASSPGGVIVVDDRFIPAAVVNRVAQRRSHPHGGPPGQLKKEVGVKTGAEIVHGSTRRPKRVKVDRAEKRERPIVVRERVEPRGRGGPEVRVNPGQDNRSQGQGQVRNQGQGKGSGQGQGHGQSQGKGTGKGKG
jgi:hypothetical protein